MIYPIVAFGDPILRVECQDIDKEKVDVKELAANMFETMYAANGIGLAAPQIGKDIRIFVVDGQRINEGVEDENEIEKTLVGFKKVFINATILEETGDEWAYEEGCLSIPAVNADVFRPDTLEIHYFDEDWNEHTETYTGMAARIIQHEYDHIEGVLFTDHIKPLKRQLLKKKLSNISKGIVDADYKMRFYKK